MEHKNGKEVDDNQNDSPKDYGKGTLFPQYFAALAVCLGSVAAGAVLGYSSNISKETFTLNDIELTDDQFGWMGSIINLGAMLMCFPTGFICDFIGRKYAVLAMIIPFTVGWLLILFLKNVYMLYAGRFLTGMAGGAFCIAAPMYTSEIAQKEIRGALGSYFQLLLVVGILFANIFGNYISNMAFTIFCLCIPLLFGVVFFFQPETPVYSVRKGRENEARNALKRLRGSAWNVELELQDIKRTIEEEVKMSATFSEVLARPGTKKALVICFGLMFFQQLSGINAVIFFTGKIFEQAQSDLGANAVILVGVMQVVATFIASLIIDRFGRKLLLMGSDFLMALAGIALGIFFHIKEHDEDMATKISALPVISMCVFISTFSLGFGPIPWMISSEVVPPEIKSTVSSAAATFNWFLAFIVTKYYGPLSKGIGPHYTFYIFSGISLLGTLFVYFVLLETKGKTLEEIQEELSGIKKNKNKKGYENEAYISSAQL